MQPINGTSVRTLSLTLALLLLPFLGAHPGLHAQEVRSRDLQAADGEVRRLNDGSLLLEDFEDQELGRLPRGWYDRDGNKPLLQHAPSEQEGYRYTVMEENGNRFLRYEGTRARHINFPLLNKDMVNIHETPVLSWRVRAHKLPENANEDDNDRNDSVASVYVVFDFGHVFFRKVPKSIRYTWSTTRETGSQFSKLFGNQKIIVVESGRSRTGRWITFERNIYEDYRKLFGETPPRQPLAILVLSDGDSTGSHVKADYDDFVLKPADR